MKLKILCDALDLGNWTEPAEEILSETASSFGHSLNVTYGYIGAEAVRRTGLSISQEIVDDCGQSDGTLVLCRSNETREAFLEAMDVSVLFEIFEQEAGLEDRKKSPNCLAVVQSLDEACMTDAARLIRNYATINGISFQCVPPNGSTAESWDTIFRSASLLNGSNVLSRISAGEAIRHMIRFKDSYGLIAVPPYAGGILCAAAAELTPSPWLNRAMYCGMVGIYLPSLSDEYQKDIRYLFSPILSVADFLEYSCHLYKEASCIRASTGNVLKEYSSGKPLSVTRETQRSMTALICEQISLAGQLLAH